MDINDFELIDIQPEPQEPQTALVKQEAALVPTGSDNFLSAAAAEAGISIDPTKVDVINDFMARAKHGHQSALPMKCKGTNCAFINICPLHQIGSSLPVGKLCPVEKAVMAQWVQDTMTALHIDPADPENAVDVNMVFELAGLEMLRYRAAWQLSISPELVEERVVGYSPQGEPIVAEQPKMALLILEKYAKVIGKLREQLLATRRSQAQVGRVASDVSVRGASMFAKAKQIAENRRQGKKIADVEIIVEDPNNGLQLERGNQGQ